MIPPAALLEKINRENYLNQEELTHLLQNLNQSLKERLFHYAREKTAAAYGKRVFIRGLLEFSNYCRNNCLYCGLRRDNKKVKRYRLQP